MGHVSGMLGVIECVFGLVGKQTSRVVLDLLATMESTGPWPVTAHHSAL